MDDVKNDVIGTSGSEFVPAEESVVLQTLKEALGETSVDEGNEVQVDPPSPPATDDENGNAPPAEKTGDDVKPADGEKKALPFAVYGEDGKTPIQPPAMLVEFKANGKVRQEPLDRVVQFAQLGVYNHEREQGLQRMQEEAAQEVESVYAELEAREAAIAKLLTDPAYYEAVQERYLKEQTPEREANRAKAEAERLRAEMETTRAERQGQEFFETVVFPGIDGIMRENPELDDPEEVAARLALMLEPLRVNGRIPPSKHPQVQALIASDLRDWAKATNDRRASRRNTVVAKAQSEAQRAKNALGAVTSPASVGAAPAARRERTGPVTIDEVDDDILQSTIRSLRAG